jgi:hypothetical protein
MPGFEPVGEAPLFEAVVAQARANAGSLRTMKMGESYSFELENVDALLTAAPHLETLQCGVYCNARLMLSVLSKEAPYTALRVTLACITSSRAEGGEDLMPLAAAAAMHEGLKRLSFCLPLPVRELDAFVDAAVARQLSHVSLREGLTPAHLPSLARFLSPSLQVFTLKCSNEPLFVGDGVPAFCAALRNSSLRHIDLSYTGLWPGGVAVLDAITGHSTITQVSIAERRGASIEAQRAIGEALGRMVVAESSLYSLTVLHVGDAVVRPLCESLQDFVLPAIRRSNASLRSITFRQPDIPELVEAEQLVSVRR